MLMPMLRPEISITVHTENNEQYLVLNDPFELAESGIMVHSQMLEILEACNGTTTYEQFAQEHGADLDSKEMLQVRAFLAELSTLGLMQDAEGAQIQSAQLQAWNTTSIRKAVCAGGTYSSEPTELLLQLETMLTASKPLSETTDIVPDAILMPHIDYRVCTNGYGPSMQALAKSTADVFVIIGTSHYWGEDSVILTKKDFETPLGILPVNQSLVDALYSELTEYVSPTDIAHKPEHSIELHAVILQYLHSNRNISIVPVLVTASKPTALPDIGKRIGKVLSESGINVTLLISGDLSHVGIRFGHEVAASEMFGEVEQSDHALLALLENGDVAGYGALIEQTQNDFNVCGYAPTMVALSALGPVTGKILAYEVWDDSPTQSAVSYAGMQFCAKLLHRCG